jgi:hypothetical protein
MESDATWRSDLVWGALAAGVIGYEVYTLRSNRLDWTLTRTTRRAFKVQHPVGKAAFAIGWGWFATWFMRHILEADDPMDALLSALKGSDESP